MASGFDQASGSIDLNQYRLRVAALGFVDGTGDVFLGDGLNGVVDDDLKDFGGRDRRNDQGCRDGEKKSRDGSAFHERPTTIFLLLFVSRGGNFFGLAGSRGLRAAPARKTGAAGDEARATFVGEIRPRPLNKDKDAVLETNQKKNVDEQPRQPRYKTGDVNLAELRDCGRPADGRQAAFVVVVECGTNVRIPALSRRTRERRSTRFLFPTNQLRYVAAFLHRNW